MPETGRSTFSVTTTGVGRKDYSQNVEEAVVPLIRSYQNRYLEYQAISLPAGTSQTIDITITANTVVLLYDLYLSCPRNVLLQLYAFFQTATGTYGPIGRKSGYVSADLHYLEGFPIFRAWRITVTNFGDDDVTAYFSAHGVYTAEEEYYGLIEVDIPQEG